MPCAFGLICAALYLPASARPKQTPAPPKQVNPAPQKDNLETQYGDIRITKAHNIKGKGDFSGVQISGKETLVTVPYPRSHSVLVLHADAIKTKSEGSDQFAHANLTGNVRYTMTQNVEGGAARIVTGTAQRAVFNHKSQRIEMDGGVQVTLTDPERLAMPATIRAARAIVEMDKSPYLYTLSGPAAANDITFLPKEDAPKAGEKPKPNGVRNGIGAVHVSGYTTGTFQIGERAHFEGDGTTIELNGRDQLSHAEIRAATFDATFKIVAKRSALKSAIATGGTRYHILRPEPPKKPAGSPPEDNPLADTPPADQKPVLDDLTGRSDRLEYQAGDAEAKNAAEQETKFTLAGHVDADILAPGTLRGPAKIMVDRLIAHVSKPYSYEMKSAARNGVIRFAPAQKIAPPARPGEDTPPKAPRVALGIITVSRFDYGMYAPGNSLRLTTTQGKILLQSDDAATKTQSRFLARDITANIAPDNHVTLAKATGEVEFRVLQTLMKEREDEKTKKKTTFEIPQIIEGTAPELDFAAMDEGRSLTMPGPFRATVSDPSRLVQPGRLTGEAGDKLILTVTGETYDYELQSDRQTAQVEFTPLPPAKKPAEKPGADGKKSAIKVKKVSMR